MAMNVSDNEKVQRPHPLRALTRIFRGEKPSFPVNAVMKKSVVVLDSSRTALDAAKTMEKNRIGSIVVIEKGKAVGIVTERDIVRRIVSRKKAPTAKLKSIMSSPLRVVRPNMEVEEAVMAMRKHGIKKLAVVDSDGRLIGILTDTDVTRAMPGMLDLVKEIGNYSRLNEKSDTMGICQNCGMYSDTLQSVEGEALCEECREEESDQHETGSEE